VNGVAIERNRREVLGRVHLQAGPGRGHHLGEHVCHPAQALDLVGDPLRVLLDARRVAPGRTGGTAWVTIDQTLHPPRSTLLCRYSTVPAQIGQVLTVEPRTARRWI
jgi:hypothetical protein